MANLLQAAVASLNTAMKAYASTEATMERDGIVLSGILVSLGSQMLRVSDRQGNTKVERTDLDILADAADLVLNGEQVEPQAGDNWYLDRGNGLEQFECMAFNGEAPWRYCDPWKTRVRIHTKFQAFVDVISTGQWSGSTFDYAGSEEDFAGGT